MAERRHVVSFVRFDGIAGRTIITGYGAERLAAQEFHTLKSNVRYAYVQWVENYETRAFHVNRPTPASPLEIV